MRTTLLTADVVASRDVVADNISIGGQTLRDYILSVVAQMQGSDLVAGRQGQTLSVDTISPIASDSAGISVRLGEDQTFGIYNKEGSPSALFDSAGNATFSGELSAVSLQLSNKLKAESLELKAGATISGTLYADRIVTRFGDFDLVRTATLAATTITNITNVTNVTTSANSSTPGVEDFNTPGVSLGAEPDATSSALLALLTQDQLDQGGQFAQLDQNVSMQANLSVLGDTTLGRTSIAGSLLVDGSVRITKDGIETIGDTLYLQKNRFAGLDVMNGSLVVDTMGNVMIKGNLAVGGNLTVGGTLSASTISPLGDDVVLDLSHESHGTNEPHATPSAGFGRFIIRGAGGLAVATIDASGSAQFAGDLTASGSGTFRRLFIADQAQQQASTSAQTSGNATIGTTLLPAGSVEVTVTTTSVTDNSFIYITPIGSTNNRVLYVKSKISCQLSAVSCQPGFQVGVDQPLPNDVQFNWWIVN